MNQKHHANRYGVGIRIAKHVIFAGIAPTQCVVGIIWSIGHIELCLGPIVIGVLRTDE